ncbi:MAG TPA: TRAP transporter small permease [Burkholderiaceae bacterium]|jgi:TRAP-type C4-dicarboxylate transport system permease small subunit|nr:TRAP transporter small permease [Burkholderiaceae bacterium]
MATQWFDRASTGYLRLLEAICLLLMSALAIVVVVGVTYRKLGASLVWYDEVASILLAWITYYGAALAAYKGAHIAVTSIVDAMPRRLRIATVLFAEAVVIAFFALLAWVGWYVLDVLRYDTLVSLPEVPVAVTQSVIPIGAVLFIVAELLRLPAVLEQARRPERG